MPYDKKLPGYHQINNPLLTQLYEKNRLPSGDIHGRINYLIKYLNQELNKLPLFEWAEMLSLGVHGNYVGLNKLEAMAIKKLERLNSRE